MGRRIWLGRCSIARHFYSTDNLGVAQRIAIIQRYYDLLEAEKTELAKLQLQLAEATAAQARLHDEVACLEYVNREYPAEATAQKLKETRKQHEDTVSRVRGLEQNTVWIVLGDHGEAFGQHEGNYGHTFQLHEENVHVPFLIAMPGQAARQIRSRKVVSLIDTAPTVLALAGLPAPPDYQGGSMLDPAPRMALFFADYSLGMLGLRDGSSKFIYEMDSGRFRLFNLESDRGEKTNLAAGNSEQAAWYQENLRNWSATQKRLIGLWSYRHAAIRRRARL